MEQKAEDEAIKDSRGKDGCFLRKMTRNVVILKKKLVQVDSAVKTNLSP